MMLVLAWNNVRDGWAGLAASFTSVLLAVMLVAGGGLLIAGADTRADLDGIVGLLAVSAAVSAFVSVFVVAGTLSLHVLRQRRTWALLRSVGMTSRQVRRLVMAEALMLGVLAAVPGCVLAVPYALVMGAVLRVTGLAPGGVPVRITAGPFVPALVAGLVVTLLAARVAAREATRVGPLEVLRDSADAAAAAAVAARGGGGGGAGRRDRAGGAGASGQASGRAADRAGSGDDVVRGRLRAGPGAAAGAGRAARRGGGTARPGAGDAGRVLDGDAAAAGDVGRVPGGADRGAVVHLSVRRGDQRRGGRRHPYRRVGVGGADAGGVGGDLHRCGGAERDRDVGGRAG
ncbi:putative ABC transporter integral membrane protein [[Actinomadura] parvosata subsp. kistnae]|nr:putative ABC transporter integral membrane protein [Actinomadura parvosata subsp. kistnae]